MKPLHLCMEEEERYNAMSACGRVFPAERWTRDASAVSCKACLRVQARADRRARGKLLRGGIGGAFDP
jgi:hypothetical protein